MKVLKLLGYYFLTLFFFTSFFLFLFHTSFFSYQKVLFYRGAILLILTTIIFFIFSFFLSIKNKKVRFVILISTIIFSASINLSLFVVLPVTFERSLTMFLLTTLESNRTNSCQGLTKKELEDRLINDYIIENKAIDKRINEQSIIDFVEEKKQCIDLTSKGLNFLRLSKLIEKLYNLQLTDR